MVFVKNAAKIQQKFDIRKCFCKFIFFVNIVLQIIYFYCRFVAFLSYLGFPAFVLKVRFSGDGPVMILFLIAHSSPIQPSKAAGAAFDSLVSRTR